MGPKAHFPGAPKPRKKGKALEPESYEVPNKAGPRKPEGPSCRLWEKGHLTKLEGLKDKALVVGPTKWASIQGSKAQSESRP